MEGSIRSPLQSKTPSSFLPESAQRHVPAGMGHARHAPDHDETPDLFREGKGPGIMSFASWKSPGSRSGISTIRRSDGLPFIHAGKGTRIIAGHQDHPPELRTHEMEEKIGATLTPFCFMNTEISGRKKKQPQPLQRHLLIDRPLHIEARLMATFERVSTTSEEGVPGRPQPPEPCFQRARAMASFPMSRTSMPLPDRCLSP